MAGHFSFKVAGIVSGTTQIRSRPTEADPLIFLSLYQKTQPRPYRAQTPLGAVLMMEETFQ
jgi:hypothetical protein